MGRFDGVADAFAVVEGCFADQLALCAVDRDAVPGIRPRLFSADVELHRAVDRSDGIGDVGAGLRAAFLLSAGLQRWRLLEPGGLKVFDEPFAAAFAPVTAFPIAAESASGVKKIGAVDPDHSGFDL